MDENKKLNIYKSQETKYSIKTGYLLLAIGSYCLV